MGIFDSFIPWRRSKPEDWEKPTWDAPGDFSFIDPWGVRVDSMTVEELYRDQPHLRTVTSFIARMVSTVSLHVYRREDDGGRERVRENDPQAGGLARLMRRANDNMLMAELLTQTVMDLCL